jgi:hypothetical protein
LFEKHADQLAASYINLQVVDPTNPIPPALNGVGLPPKGSGRLLKFGMQMDF